jgi:gamma-glutamylcyclotransferase (GGCT)/AIG2-like uncharacterized protein YtfP
MSYKYKHLIVAYGSNLCLRDFSAFAKRNGKSGDCLNFEKVVTIPDYEICFNTRSKGRKGGVLNIQPALGTVTPAGLFSTNDEGLALLRKKEGVPFKYEETEIIVIDQEGSEVSALTYIVPPNRTEGFVSPHPEYLKICEEGLEHWGLDTFDLQDAAEGKRISPLPAIFTYGTLMRGESRFSIVYEGGLSCALMGQCFGTLSTNNSYPALDLKADGFAWGDYFVSDDITSLLQKTDEIEGFYGFGSPRNLFRRTCVDVDVGAVGQRFAWVYVMDEALPQKINDNDWRAYRGRRDEFVEGLLKVHSREVDNFNELLSKNYLRFSRLDNQEEVLDDNQIIDLIVEGHSMSERDVAQVSGCWNALAIMNGENV